MIQDKFINLLFWIKILLLIIKKLAFNCKLILRIIEKSNQFKLMVK